MKLVVGGSSGIGLEVARQLMQRGEEVVVASRSEERCQQAAMVLGCRSETLDARSFQAVEALLSQLQSVDGLACTAGSLLLKPAHLTSEQDLQEALQANLFTAFACVRAMARQARGGSVVLISTVAASLGLASHEAMAASKAGVEGLVRSAAATYAQRGLRINAVAPGLVDTPMSQRITSRPASLKAAEALIPLGRIGRPQEIASLCSWLLGPDSAWVTGQVFGVDGGMSTLRR